MDWLLRSGVISICAMALAALYFTAGLGPALHCMLQSAARQKYRAALLPLQYLLPVSILSGSLLLPIVLHVLIDLAILALYRPLPDDRVAT